MTYGVVVPRIRAIENDLRTFGGRLIGGRWTERGGNWILPVPRRVGIRTQTLVVEAAADQIDIEPNSLLVWTQLNICDSLIGVRLRMRAGVRDHVDTSRRYIVRTV